MNFQISGQPGLSSGAPILMRDIVKKFRTGTGEVTVLKSINASFEPGEFVGVIGKSGSGKSTLVNMLTGIDRPTSGEVQIGDTLVHRLNESQMSRWRGLNLGIVFQFYQLLPVLSLLENTMLPMDIAGRIPPARRETRALELLRMVGLEDVAHKTPAAVSGGQQQAAAIARALANDPPFIVADEPTGNLDSKTAEKIFNIFEGLVDQGKTIIMVTHDPQLSRRTTRTMLLCDGEVVHPAVAAALPWLNHAQMLRLTQNSRLLRVPAGARVIAPGRPMNELNLLVSGALELQPGGERLGPGEMVGLEALLANKPANFSAVALEETELLVIDEELIRALGIRPGPGVAPLASASTQEARPSQRLNPLASLFTKLRPGSKTDDRGESRS